MDYEPIEWTTLELTIKGGSSDQRADIIDKVRKYVRRLKLPAGITIDSSWTEEGDNFDDRRLAP